MKNLVKLKIITNFTVANKKDNSVKNNGELYAKPTWYQFAGTEKNAQDIIARLEELNPGKTFVAA